MIPSISAEQERAGAVRWLSRSLPTVTGPNLGELGLFQRGWRDDFLGDLVRDEYEQRTEVAARSSLVLQDGAHGGVLRLLTGNQVSDYARLMLGASSDLFDTLDPDNGFRLIGYWKLSSTASILGDKFVNAPAWNFIHITADTAIGANWMLRTDNNSGVEVQTDSGVAFDTDQHWHQLYVESGYAAHYLDGLLINSTTSKIPTVPMTADFRCLTRTTAVKYLDLDYWAVIPE